MKQLTHREHSLILDAIEHPTECPRLREVFSMWWPTLVYAGLILFGGGVAVGVWVR